MPFKTILNVIGGEGIDQDLQAAMELCNQVSAHLSVFLAVMAPQPTGRYATLAPSWFEARERNLQEIAERVDNIVVELLRPICRLTLPVPTRKSLELPMTLVNGHFTRI